MTLNEITTLEALQTTTPESTLTEAAKTMKTANWGVLPVVNEKQEVIGVITDRDICLALAAGTTAATKKVKEVMTTTVTTVTINDTVEAVLRVMREGKVSRVPVLDSTRKLKGIVSFHTLVTIAGSKGKFDSTLINDKGENIVKTMYALSERYTGTTSKQPTVTGSVL